MGLCLTTSTYSEETTENLIENENWVLEGDVYMQETIGNQGYDSSFNIRFGKEGGTATQQLDFSAYEQVDAINYRMLAIGCNNEGTQWCHAGTAYDEVIVTLNYGDEQWQHNITLDYLDGFSLHEATSVPTGYSTTGSVSIWARDVGLWNGWYGPVTADHYLSVTHSVPAYDPVLDDPNFLNSITGVQDNIMNVAIHHEPVPQIELIATPQPQVLQVELKQPQPQQQQQQQPQKESSKNVTRLNTVMDNVTIGGVPASELGSTDAYNQVAQAVAISLLTATVIKDTYIADAPFYNQEQLEDATLSDSYTGYVAINRSRINQLVDMQWQQRK